MCFPLQAPDPLKVSAVSNWTIPTAIEEVCKFIGLASYNRHYVQGFSDIFNRTFTD